MFAVNGSINTELLFIYGLVALVVVLIIILIIIDRIENKKDKKRRSLSDTLNMKPITNDMLVDYKYKEDKKDEKNDEIIVKSENIPEIKLDLKFEDNYKETELDKTQAQIRVEEIKEALEEDGVDQEIEKAKDKYASFEEEQEKNAIISYDELMNSYDKLYEENEKTQYLQDDQIPINIKELYELSEKEIPNEVKEEEKVNEQSESTFKSSPYISPVYGIQKPADKEIENGNDFLNNLKELRSNLE